MTSSKTRIRLSDFKAEVSLEENAVRDIFILYLYIIFSI